VSGLIAGLFTDQTIRYAGVDGLEDALEEKNRSGDARSGPAGR
jgi:hypothetical protein